MTEETKKPKRDRQGGKFRIQIRALLRGHPEGLTLKQMGSFMVGESTSIYRALKRMPDAYCSHWIEPDGERMQAVYKVVMVPPDCPPPLVPRQTIEERREYQRQYRLKRQLVGSHVVKEKPRRIRLQKVIHLPEEEVVARNQAMVNRYSNPPTYKPIK